jgi:hypothetical protein
MAEVEGVAITAGVSHARFLAGAPFSGIATLWGAIPIEN